MPSVRSVLLIALLFIINNYVKGDIYKVGVGRADCTGPAAGINMMGYVNPLQNGKGIHLRQFSRAFIVDDNSNRVVFATVDIGMIGYWLRQEVLDKLAVKYGNLYNENNVIISGTHTHQTPGGFLLNFMYDLAPFAGFVQETFDAYANGIFRSIDRAHESLVDGKVIFKNTDLLEANKNRRSGPYLENPQAEQDMYTNIVDKTLLQLEFIRASDGASIGAFNWFAVHPTSMDGFNRYITSDNIGYASMVLEQLVNPDDLAGKGSFVGAMAATNLGDVGPDGEGDDSFKQTKNVGEKIANASYDLYLMPGRELSGDINSVSQFLNMSSETVQYTFENGTTITGKGCLPAVGIGYSGSDTAGLVDMVYELNITLPEMSEEDAACHSPKQILIPTGIMSDPYEWQQLIVPVQVAYIGPLVFAAVPGEFTTMSGRRIQRALKSAMQTKPGINPDHVHVVIAGLSNSYTSYVATPEEYMVQAYEGSFTSYGPFTLPIYVNNFANILQSLIDGIPVERGTPPPEYPYPRLTLIEEVDPDGGVFPAGECLQQPPQSALKGTLVLAVFQAGHPRNNVMHEQSFLTIELKQEDGSWKVVANDASWETKFRYAKDYSPFGIYAGGGHLTVEWIIPDSALSGTYIIRHFGHFKDNLGNISPYSGNTREFQVR